jgi:hypothetical protein
MCTPALALGSQAFGVGQSTVGAYATAASQKSALQSQARIADINATLIDAQARATLAASEKQQNQILLRGGQIKAAQQAAYAANGIDLASPTAVNVETGTDYVTQADADQARANGIANAWGYRIQAGNARAQANSARASAASISPLMAGATSLITGAGQVASSWYKMDSLGAFSGSRAGAVGTPGQIDDVTNNLKLNNYLHQPEFGPLPTIGGIQVGW